ncbi:MAG: hypothetical protein M1820_007742 [Bogoriella megaspora]|nr:MAG: hypothetical protein M1820_007742 [Bogoriella megaspora]
MFASSPANKSSRMASFTLGMAISSPSAQGLQKLGFTSGCSRPLVILYCAVLLMHTYTLIIPKPPSPTQSIKFGITTALDMRNNPDLIKHLKEVVEQRGDHADIKSAFTPAVVEGGWPVPMMSALNAPPEVHQMLDAWPKIRKLGDANDFVDEHTEYGADYIKVLHETDRAMALGQMPSFSNELQRAMVAAKCKNVEGGWY